MKIMKKNIKQILCIYNNCKITFHKVIITFILIVSFNFSYGQFGIIVDKDGYVNVRSTANKSINNIIDTLSNNEIVWVFDIERDWYVSEFNLEFLMDSKTGYIHKSRVKLINDYKKIPIIQKNDSLIIFKNDTILLMINKEKFNIENQKITYDKSEEIPLIKLINGRRTYGNDGRIPIYQYGKMILQIDSTVIQIPINNCFEPNLENISLNIDEENGILYISTLDGDASASYAMLWIINNRKILKHIITSP